jgi:hypothetical protein
MILAARLPWAPSAVGCGTACEATEHLRRYVVRARVGAWRWLEMVKLSFASVVCKLSLTCLVLLICLQGQKLYGCLSAVKTRAPVMGGVYLRIIGRWVVMVFGSLRVFD